MRRSRRRRSSRSRRGSKNTRVTPTLICSSRRTSHSSVRVRPLVLSPFSHTVLTRLRIVYSGHNFNPDRPPTPRASRTDDALRREEEELQRALAESAALADPLRNYRPSAGRATSPGGGKALPQPVPSPGPHHPQQQQQQPAGRVRGLYDFVGETSDELPFRRGDLIRVLERVSEEWWKGELKGRVGIFPTNYVVRRGLSPLSLRRIFAILREELTISCAPMDRKSSRTNRHTRITAPPPLSAASLRPRQLTRRPRKPRFLRRPPRSTSSSRSCTHCGRAAKTLPTTTS